MPDMAMYVAPALLRIDKSDSLYLIIFRSIEIIFISIQVASTVLILPGH